MKQLFFAAIAAALFFSCEKSLSPDLSMDKTNPLEAFNSEFTPPSFNDELEAMPAAANGGAQVIRYDDEWGFRFIDDETQNEAWVNIKFEELCGGDRIRDIIAVQDVVINEKDGTPRIITLWKGQDVSVNVYENRYQFCDEYENAEPIYSGIGDCRWTDNNFGLVEEGDKNSAGFILQGEGISIIFNLSYNGKIIKSKTKIMIK